MDFLDVTRGKHIFIQTDSPMLTHHILITGAHVVLNIIDDDGEQINSFLESNFKTKESLFQNGLSSCSVSFFS